MILLCFDGIRIRQYLIICVHFLSFRSDGAPNVFSFRCKMDGARKLKNNVRACASVKKVRTLSSLLIRFYSLE